MTEIAIYTINITCIALMVLLVIILSLATKLKGGAAYAAIIILFCNTSVYIYNMARNTGQYDLAQVGAILANLNALLMPLMWLFTRRELDASFRFRPVDLLHFLPSLVLIAVAILHFGPMPSAEFRELMILETGGKPGVFMGVNDTVIAIQVLVYFPLIFLFIRRIRKRLQDHYSDADYMNVLWVKRVMIFFAVQFALIVVLYAIFRTIDIWFVPIMNLISCSYLVYQCITNPTTAYLSRIDPAIFRERSSKPEPVQLDSGQMEHYSGKVISYLTESEAYRNPEFSLSMLAVETGISPKNISRSINSYLNKNFFDLINEMRVEEAKKKLLSLDESHTIESVAGECGFRSRSSFFAAFKKSEGTTPARWLSSHSA